MTATRYPVDVAREVGYRRPDLAKGNAISTVLTVDPTLTADQVIATLDQAAADFADEIDADTETAILSIGDEFLPPVARRVRDGERDELTEAELTEYRRWLVSQAYEED